MVTRGTQGNDSITGGDRADDLRGLGGDDTLEGGDGADILRGGAGDDLLLGGSGGDDLRGGGGSDSLQGQSGDDVLRGGDGDDVLGGGQSLEPAPLAPRELASSEPGDDRIFGGAGRDVLGGGAGFDQLFGGSGDDVLSDDDGRGALFGGTGEDDLRIAAVIAIADGSAFGEEGDDRIVGFARFGRLVLDGGDGGDEIRGTAETLTLRGRAGDDTLRVGFTDQPDALTESTKARLTGGGGNDQLFGGLGVNTLHGGGGDDILVSFGRNDRLTGGAGRDLVGIVGPYETVRTEDVVTDLVRGEDRLYIQGRSFADFDTNRDGVLDGNITTGGADQVTIADVTLNGVTRSSTIIMLTPVAVTAGAEAPRGGVLAPDSTLVVFGVTGLTADDFLSPAEM